MSRVKRAMPNPFLLLSIVLWCVALSGAPVRGGAADGVKHGEYRTWHDNGQLAEVRRYVRGREVGLQQSWTRDGVLYLNYEVRNGRRYGLINARPCEPGDDGAMAGTRGGVS